MGKQILVEPRLQGSRKKNGQAAWRVDIRNPNIKLIGYENGRKRVPLHFETKAEALRECEKINRLQDGDGYLTNSVAGTFDAAVACYIAKYKKKADGQMITHRWKKNQINKANAWCEQTLMGIRVGDMKLCDFTEMVCETVFDNMPMGKTAKTRYEWSANLYNIFDLAIKQKKFQGSNPVNIEIEEPKYVDAEELDQENIDREKYNIETITNIVSQIKDQKDALIIKFGAMTGMRVGEICALRWSEVDFSENRIFVMRSRREGENGESVVSIPKFTSGKRREKNKRRRLVPIPKTLLKDLKAWRLASPASKDGDFVFCKTDPRWGIGVPYTSADQWKRRALFPACEKAGVPRFTYHQLRHFYASWCISEFGIKNQEGIAKISLRMGHQDINFTYRQYGDWIESKETDDRDADQLDSVWEESMEKNKGTGTP